MNISPLQVWQWRGVGVTERALLTVSIICGVSYLLAPFFLAAQVREYWPVNAAIKGCAIASLAVLVWRMLKERDGQLLSLALTFSSLGDIFLALRTRNYFVFGLLSFLVAHLVFTALWIRNWALPVRASRKQKLLIGALLIFLGIMLWWLLPVPGLSFPVAIYMCVLTIMVMSAVLIKSNGDWIIIGAILFLFSDTIIALSTFKQVVGGKLAGFLIWSTYYLAQYLMTFGFLSENKLKSSN
jgi:uncharacterized membrane protein YhhN